MQIYMKFDEYEEFRPLGRLKLILKFVALKPKTHGNIPGNRRCRIYRGSRNQ
jgi:hypothetical protein